MKVIFFITHLFCILPLITQAQKKAIDSLSIEKWRYLLPETKFSNNGKHVYYQYKRIGNKCDSLVLKKTTGEFINSYLDIANYDFSSNSFNSIMLSKSHKLIIEKILNKSISQHFNVDRYELLISSGKEFICFNKGDSLFIKSLDDHYEAFYAGVTSLYTLEKRNGLLFKQGDSIKYFDLSLKKAVFIESGNEIANPILSHDGSNLAYYKSDGSTGKIMCFTRGVGLRYISLDVDSVSLGTYAIDPFSIKFTRESDKILFKIVRKKDERGMRRTVAVWNTESDWMSYVDEHEPYSKLCAYNLNKQKLQVLPIGNMLSAGRDLPNRYIVSLQSYRMEDYWWDERASQNLKLTDIDNATTSVILKTTKNIFDVKVSPSEHYIVWFDDRDKHYYSYNIITRNVNNISKSLNVPVYDIDADFIGLRNPFGILGWAKDEKSCYIYDKFDVWQLDLSGIKTPKCITNGYGRKHNISFRYAFNTDNSFNTIEDNNEILLAAFDFNNMNNGFYKADLGKTSDPVKCTMGPYVYFFPTIFGGNGGISFGHSCPRKLVNSDFYIVEREDSQTPLNYFLTRDFKNFVQVSNSMRLEESKWHSSQLVRWALPEGDSSTGILYKPEDFDTTKSYPIIFEYYEKRSPELNKFIIPSFSIARINIPFYLSRDYLIFVPDIHYKTGKNGESVVKSVVSAAKKMTAYRWVDSTKMGLQGHSFGGYETNYLITGTSIFSAACEVAGTSNLVSGYGQLVGLNNKGGSRQIGYERYQGNIGCSLLDCPELYIKNSPIFRVKNISTPLLMVHNRDDQSVLFSQAIELFNAMRRAQKKAWLVQYENQGHVILGEESIDFSTKMLQFFDYYLKNTEMPEWMKINTSSLGDK